MFATSVASSSTRWAAFVRRPAGAIAGLGQPPGTGRLRRPTRIRIVGARVCGWLAVRHSLLAEAAVVLALYLAYEGSRGLVRSDASAAVEHARAVASLERSLHLFVERAVQDAALAVPGLAGALGLAYLSLHLAVTAGVLVWLHQRRPAAFPVVRTVLLLATGLALVGFVVFPTAPPRLAALGIADTVSGRHIDLNRGFVSSLYNPYAAVPSMHVGYALVVGASLLRYGRRRALRLIGAAYPLFVLVVVVATGNHFLFDAFIGAVVAGLATAAALLVARRPLLPRVELGRDAVSTADGGVRRAAIRDRLSAPAG